jgi:hypothetical protein
LLALNASCGFRVLGVSWIFVALRVVLLVKCFLLYVVMYIKTPLAFL